MSYDFPVQERYEYVSNGLATDDRYAQRVKLLPVRYEEPHPAESTRYVLAPRYDEPAPPSSYIRVEQGFAGDQVYERDGQLYHARHGSQTYAQGYRY